MEVKFSKSKIPYIEIDSSNRLAFSEITASKKSYKYFIFSGMYKTIGKREIYYEKSGFIIEVNFKNLGKESRKISKEIKTQLTIIRKNVSKYIEDGNFPKNKLLTLSKRINPKHGIHLLSTPNTKRKEGKNDKQRKTGRPKATSK